MESPSFPNEGSSNHEETLSNQGSGGDKGRDHVDVSVYTTSGSYPRSGFEKQPISAVVNKVLEEAKRSLQLTDTTNWIARIDGKEIDPAKTYRDNHLSGKVKIQWGPREGGGGSC
jgi:hypothetical protein